MKKMCSAWMCFGFLQFAAPAWAGNVAGNGGDVIDCDGKKLELLDYFEGRTVRKFHIDLTHAGKTYLEKVQTVLKEMGKFDPERARDYLSFAREFLKQVDIIPDIILEDIPDSLHGSVPEGCEIKQIAIQREPQLPGDKPYVISKDLWDQLDENNKAGLILHEVIYKDAIEREHENSVMTRYFNAFISSTALKEGGLPKYFQVLDIVNIGFRPDGCTDINGVSYETYHLDFYENGNLRGGEICNRKEAVLKIGRNQVKVNDRVYFYPDGNIETIVTDRGLINSIRISPSNILWVGDRTGPSNKWERCSTDFYPSGALKKAHIARKVIIDGNEYEAGETLTLDEQGAVIE